MTVLFHQQERLFRLTKLSIASLSGDPSVELQLTCQLDADDLAALDLDPEAFGHRVPKWTDRESPGRYDIVVSSPDSSGVIEADDVPASKPVYRIREITPADKGDGQDDLPTIDKPPPEQVHYQVDVSIALRMTFHSDRRNELWMLATHIGRDIRIEMWSCKMTQMSMPEGGQDGEPKPPEPEPEDGPSGGGDSAQTEEELLPGLFTARERPADITVREPDDDVEPSLTEDDLREAYRAGLVDGVQAASSRRSDDGEVIDAETIEDVPALPAAEAEAEDGQGEVEDGQGEVIDAETIEDVPALPAAEVEDGQGEVEVEDDDYEPMPPLSEQTTACLQEQYAQHFGEPTKSRNRAWLIRKLEEARAGER